MKYNEMRVSTPIKKFFSDLIISFIVQIAPLIRILTTAMKLKTVNDQVVRIVLETLLVKEYNSPDGHVTYKDDHQELFDAVDSDIETYHKYLARAAAAKKQSGDDEDASMDEE